MRVLIHSLALMVKLVTRGGEFGGEEVVRFADRALLAPPTVGVVVYDTDQSRRYLQYLRSLGLGPKKVWFVEKGGLSLFHALDRESATLQEVLEAADSIAPFVSWQETNKFREEWGLDRGQWYCQDREDHLSLENKAEFRRNNPDEWFSEYGIFPAEDIKRIQEYGFRLMVKYGKILVRHPKKASGVGLRFLENPWELVSPGFVEFLQGFAGEELLVEQFFSGAEEYSITWERGLGGEVRQLYWSGQFIKDGVHQGNLIASSEILLPEEAQGAIEEIEAATREIVSKHESPGRYGFDLLIRPSGEWVIIESNCRFGGSAYPAFVRERLGEDRVVALHKLHDPGVESFEGVHEILEENDLAYDSQAEKGVFVSPPIHLPDLCEIIVVGEDDEGVEKQLEEALELFV